MLELAVKLREETGKNNKQLRKQGFIPAILYGHKTKNTPLMVKYQDLENIYKETGESVLIKLKIKDQKDAKDKERTVLIHDIQKEPMTDKFIHADFYQVKMDEVLRAEVPLEFIGQSPAVAEQSGVLVKSIQEVEVEALPQNLPREIKVDISTLKTFDDNIHIKDLEVANGVKIMASPEEVVASVGPPRKEQELEGLEKAPEEKVEEVKTEAEEKREVKAEKIEEKKEEEKK